MIKTDVIDSDLPFCSVRKNEKGEVKIYFAKGTVRFQNLNYAIHVSKN